MRGFRRARGVGRSELGRIVPKTRPRPFAVSYASRSPRSCSSASRGQVPVGRSIICTLVPIRRASVKMLSRPPGSTSRTCGACRRCGGARRPPALSAGPHSRPRKLSMSIRPPRSAAGNRMPWRSGSSARASSNLGAKGDAPARADGLRVLLQPPLGNARRPGNVPPSSSTSLPARAERLLRTDTGADAEDHQRHDPRPRALPGAARGELSPSSPGLAPVQARLPLLETAKQGCDALAWSRDPSGCGPVSGRC